METREKKRVFTINKNKIAFIPSAISMNIQIKNHINANSEKWLVTLLTGFSLFFVLFIYQGYNIQAGVSYSGHSLLFRASAFGFLTSLTFFINEFYLSDLFSSIKISSQTILISLIWPMGVAFFTGKSNA